MKFQSFYALSTRSFQACFRECFMNLKYSIEKRGYTRELAVIYKTQFFMEASLFSSYMNHLSPIKTTDKLIRKTLTFAQYTIKTKFWEVWSWTRFVILRSLQFLQCLSYYVLQCPIRLLPWPIFACICCNSVWYVKMTLQQWIPHAVFLIHKMNLWSEIRNVRWTSSFYGNEPSTSIDINSYCCCGRILP